VGEAAGGRAPDSDRSGEGWGARFSCIEWARETFGEESGLVMGVRNGGVSLELLPGDVTWMAGESAADP